MDLKEITLWRQPYTLYVAVIMIILIIIKSEEIPRKITGVIGGIMLVLILLFIFYIIRQTLL